uniref:Golgi apparatus membrane protein TVP23 homolog n=1 Tax=Macrostomum lignano TaxID=282301 RepID=A0A1I8FMS2_9PLAT
FHSHRRLDSLFWFIASVAWAVGICGFANVFLMGASLWFLFKETVWFKRMYLSRPTASPTLLAAGADPSGGSGGYQQKGGVETGAVCHLSSSASESLWWRLA